LQLTVKEPIVGGANFLLVDRDAPADAVDDSAEVRRERLVVLEAVEQPNNNDDLLVGSKETDENQGENRKLVYLDGCKPIFISSYPLYVVVATLFKYFSLC
jgi:hypothetical protein